MSPVFTGFDDTTAEIVGTAGPDFQEACWELLSTVEKNRLSKSVIPLAKKAFDAFARDCLGGNADDVTAALGSLVDAVRSAENDYAHPLLLPIAHALIDQSKGSRPSAKIFDALVDFPRSDRTVEKSRFSLLQGILKHASGQTDIPKKLAGLSCVVREALQANAIAHAGGKESALAFQQQAVAAIVRDEDKISDPELRASFLTVAAAHVSSKTQEERDIVNRFFAVADGLPNESKVRIFEQASLEGMRSNNFPGGLLLCELNAREASLGPSCGRPETLASDDKWAALFAQLNH